MAPDKVSNQTVDLTKSESEEKGISNEILKILKSFRSEFRTEILELKVKIKSLIKNSLKLTIKLKMCVKIIMCWTIKLIF